MRMLLCMNRMAALRFYRIQCQFFVLCVDALAEWTATVPRKGSTMGEDFLWFPFNGDEVLGFGAVFYGNVDPNDRLWCSASLLIIF